LGPCVLPQALASAFARVGALSAVNTELEAKLALARRARASQRRDELDDDDGGARPTTTTTTTAAPGRGAAASKGQRRAPLESRDAAAAAHATTPSGRRRAVARASAGKATDGDGDGDGDDDDDDGDEGSLAPLLQSETIKLVEYHAHLRDGRAQADLRVLDQRERIRRAMAERAAATEPRTAALLRRLEARHQRLHARWAVKAEYYRWMEQRTLELVEDVRRVSRPPAPTPTRRAAPPHAGVRYAAAAAGGGGGGDGLGTLFGQHMLVRRAAHEAPLVGRTAAPPPRAGARRARGGDTS
jgi:hypothetical protein